MNEIENNEYRTHKASMLGLFACHPHNTIMRWGRYSDNSELNRFLDLWLMCNEILCYNQLMEPTHGTMY